MNIPFNKQFVSTHTFGLILKRQIAQHPLPWTADTLIIDEDKKVHTVKASDGVVMAECEAFGEATLVALSVNQYKEFLLTDPTNGH